MSNLPTPKTSFKKRPVSSPEDSVEVKKLKPIPEMDEVTYPSSGMSANVANLTLSTEDLQAMAILIKDFIKADSILITGYCNIDDKTDAKLEVMTKYVIEGGSANLKHEINTSTSPWQRRT